VDLISNKYFSAVEMNLSKGNHLVLGDKFNKAEFRKQISRI